MSNSDPTLLVATQNRDKIREITDLFKSFNINIKSLHDFPNLSDIKETGNTLEENALLKAKLGYKWTGITTLADDTGLEVDALNGAPGVMSARYSGPSATYESNVRKLLENMTDIPEKQRIAHFRCVMALVWKDGSRMVEGRVDGLILTEPRGSDGFGYDPVFYHVPTGLTFAEMPLVLKNQLSHRALALQKILSILRDEYQFSIL
jgi:XTP/dITP diphosphohydrolase